MRYEKLMALLKFADGKPVLKIIGDWAHDDHGKRGPLIQTINEGIAEGQVEVDPANRLHLTDAGYRRYHKVGGNVRITVVIPKERETEFRQIVADFLR